MRHSESSLKREIHSITVLCQGTTKILNNQFNFHEKEFERDHQTKPKATRSEEIIKIRTGINKIESLKNIKSQ